MKAGVARADSVTPGENSPLSHRVSEISRHGSEDVALCWPAAADSPMFIVKKYVF